MRLHYLNGKQEKGFQINHRRISVKNKNSQYIYIFVHKYTNDKKYIKR